MRRIELQNGYMVCVDCQGYIEAGDMTPACDCIDDNSTSQNEIPNYLN